MISLRKQHFVVPWIHVYFIENVGNTLKNILILTFSYWAMKIAIKNYPNLTWPFSGCLVQQWGKEEGGRGRVTDSGGVQPRFQVVSFPEKPSSATEIQGSRGVLKSRIFYFPFLRP